MLAKMVNKAEENGPEKDLLGSFSDLIEKYSDIFRVKVSGVKFCRRRTDANYFEAR